MSSDTIQATAQNKPDYTIPIARIGEQQFACIMRQRSGFSAGSIEVGIRDIAEFSDSDKQDLVNCAFSIYESFCERSGKIALRDAQKSGPG